MLEALAKQEQKIIRAAETGIKRAALHLVARARMLAPMDTGNLQNSVATDGRVYKTSSSLRVIVGATATGGKGAEWNYSAKVHENMKYDGPNVGGSQTQNRGPRTLKKGVSKIEPTDGSAGGKYLERPMRNKAEVYTNIVMKNVQKVL